MGLDFIAHVREEDGQWLIHPLVEHLHETAKLAGENAGKFVAHTPPKGSDQWHGLAEHLLETAKLATSFGRNEQENQMLHLAGLLHDLGKYQDGFQKYLISAHEGKKIAKVPHAMMGALAAYNLKLSQNLPR